MKRNDVRPLLATAMTIAQGTLRGASITSSLI